jgi:hypothetical protein
MFDVSRVQLMQAKLAGCFMFLWLLYRPQIKGMAAVQQSFLDTVPILG